MNNLLIILASQMDFGWTVALVGFFIVFFALTLLVIVFLRLPKLINMKFKKKEPKKKAPHCEDTEGECHIEGNVTAAIGMALHLYFINQHDEESNIVTIKKVKKAYSPWSSKIYSVTNNWPR
ncbi:OadG family protein [Sunxiuqinia indica]|uniref:OadG family protein n=1 Tax=Sunxiuqinia indica TaxID=2692584 RepID=UPI001F3BB0FC|nr:OadG family protein [Sunxiuqinia indica]